MTERQARQLSEMLQRWVIRLGGQVRDDDFNTWRVTTYAGPLVIHRPQPSDRRFGPHLFTHFDDIARAHEVSNQGAGLNLSRYCSKWNHYWDKSYNQQVSAVFAYFNTLVENLCIMPATLPIGLLWARFGDMGNHHEFFGLTQLVEAMHEADIAAVPCGSSELFWGDRQGQRVRPCTWAERQYVADGLLPRPPTLKKEPSCQP